MVRLSFLIRVPGLALRVIAPVLASLGTAAGASCSGLVPGHPSGLHRKITARDLIELREVGFPDGAISGASPLAVSPDGKSIAFVLSRADVETNSYCRSLLVLPLRPRQKPSLIDRGGEFIPLGTFVRGLWVEVGLPKLVTPAWSPDGRSLAVLERSNGVTQAVVIPLDGSRGRIATHSEVDVEGIWWAADGTKLHFVTRPGMRSTQELIDREGESGWLYDKRMAPNYGSRPRIRESDAQLKTWQLELKDGSTRPSSGGDLAIPGAGPGGAVSRRGLRAWFETQGVSPFAPQRLWIANPAGHKRECEAESCGGRFLGLWWSPSGDDIWFQRREGWNNEVSAFYRLRAGNLRPVRTLATLDVIQNCVPAGPKLACTAENSTTPRKIVLIDPATGSRVTIFDTNPELADLNLGTVRRLRWRNDRGLEAWGDLVLPPDYRRGSKLPLIVVQYQSRGFLRGGTGNEYPIFPLAAHGFAVLSFERPPEIGSTMANLRTDVELNAANEKGWAERKSMLSATLRGLDLAIATGAIDPRRIGITGLSDGATAARFALIHSDRFAAAAISSCCPEPKTSMTYGGIAWAEFNRAIGYPPATVEDPDFWAPMSIAQNAARMRTPLLMQQSDDEYLLSLEAFEALREHDDPVELYVFPGEHHVKWQPRHKLAVFSRAVDWFDFWLKGYEDPDPRKSEQYRRWEAMRSGPAVSGSPRH